MASNSHRTKQPALTSSNRDGSNSHSLFRRPKAELQHDIAVIVPRLPAELQIVWEWLQSATVRRTARGFRVSPMTVYQRLKRLRSAFLAADLGISFQKVETPRRRRW